MQCSCADVNSLYKRKCWTNSGGPLVNSLLWGSFILYTGYLGNGFAYLATTVLTVSTQALSSCSSLVWKRNSAWSEVRNRNTNSFFLQAENKLGHTSHFSTFKLILSSVHVLPMPAIEGKAATIIGTDRGGTRGSMQSHLFIICDGYHLHKGQMSVRGGEGGGGSL